jgi:hypothetical protein
MEILNGLLTGVIVLVCLTLFCYLIGRIIVEDKTDMGFKELTTIGGMYFLLMLFLTLILTSIVMIGIFINKTFFK